MATNQATTDGTTTEGIAAAIERALEGRQLLAHPFYRRWEAGELTEGELGAYAVQYRSFEAALPVILGDVADRLRAEGNVPAAELVERNLADELGRPEPHLALFDRFADAVSAVPAPAVAGADGEGPAAAALVGTYRHLVVEGPVAALAALAAYESQAAAIAASKADGLRRWYHVDDDGTAFWDVHAEMDAEHGDWTVATLALLGADAAEVEAAARLGAEAWWSLLDEREAASLALAG